MEKKAAFHLGEMEEDTNPRSYSNMEKERLEMRKMYLEMSPAARSANIKNLIRHGWWPVGTYGGTWPRARRAFLEKLGMNEQADLWEEEHLPVSE